MNWFLVFAVIVSLLVAFYIGFRTINLFNLHQKGYFNTALKKIFWVLIITGSLSFIVSRELDNISDYWFPLIGNIVFSLIICFFYSIIIIDCFRFVRRFVFRMIGKPGYLIQISYIAIALCLFFVGLFMASNPRIVHYQIDIDKIAKVNKLKIVQISDLHINETTSINFIQKMINDVNKLRPDYIFITGDTLDLRLKPFVEKDLASFFAKLNATYGTFIIFGNHEHYGIEREENNSIDDVIAAFKAGNMKVLLDSAFYDSNTGVTIIGRDDYVVSRFDKERAELPVLINFIDDSKPIILLDHQPQDIHEPAELGIDIMFSGHTHAGQLFPITLLVNFIYENPWGMVQPIADKPFISIVTSGYGLWGPPIRLMTQAEIVVTDLNFKQTELVNP